MISHEEALRLLRQRVPVLGTEQVETGKCVARTLAADVVARLPSPPFNKAAMDGFAVRASDVGSLPVELEVAGEVFAGQWPDLCLGPGQCMRVATGAPVPEGTDMVVMVEHACELADGRVRIEKLSGKNICDRGEDVNEGQIVLRAGQTLNPMSVGVAAAAGHQRLQVYKMPSIALLCTGTEVQEAGGPVYKGQIYNSNGPMLSALLAPLGSSFDYLGIASDSKQELETAITQGLARDVFVIVGGVSVGEYDLVPRLLQRLGVEIVFHKCAIKPGKPVLFGKQGGTCIFGLPGNPQSCFVVFHVLLRPALAMMSGAEETLPIYKTGRMRVGFRNKPGRENFKPCRIEVQDGNNYIIPVPYQGSADIVGPSAADAYFVVPRGVEEVKAGQLMEFFEI